jgi:hypothetical protein
MIDRTNKTTLPGSEIIVRGQGLPMLNASGYRSDTDLKEAPRDDLILK